MHTEEFEVPEWGGSLFIGEWPAKNNAGIIALFKGSDNEDDAGARPGAYGENLRHGLH